MSHIYIIPTFRRQRGKDQLFKVIRCYRRNSSIWTTGDPTNKKNKIISHVK